MTDAHEFSDASPSSVIEAKELVEKIQDHTEAKRDETPEEEAVKLRRFRNRILDNLDDAAYIIPNRRTTSRRGRGCYY